MSRKIILLLSFWFTLLGTACAQKVRPPQDLRVENAYQREVDITWNKTLLTDIEWEIRFDGQPSVRTTDIRHTLTGLEPDTEYIVKVRMVRGKDYSAFSTLKFKTAALAYRVDDSQRVPYLRTIRIDATSPRELPLYYTDLATADARMTYRLNGQPVEPKDNILTIDTENYTDKLEILIDEGNDRQFRLIYFVNVPKGI